MSEFHLEGKADGLFAEKGVSVFDPFQVEEQSPGFEFGDFDSIPLEVLLVPDVLVPFKVVKLLSFVDVEGVDVEQGRQIIFDLNQVVLCYDDVVAQLAHVAEAHLPKMADVGWGDSSEPDMLDHLPDELIGH